MRSIEAFTVGAIATLLGVSSFFGAGHMVSKGSQGLGDLLGVCGLVLSMVGLYFLIMGAMRLRSN